MPEIQSPTASQPEEEPSNSGSPRVSWRAALLSALVNGLGQVYSGRPYRGIILHVFSVAASFIYIRSFLIPVKFWNIVIPILMALTVWLFILLDAIRCAKKAPRPYRLRAYNRWYVYVLVIILAFGEQHACVSFMKTHFELAAKIPSAAMSATIQPGDDIVVDMHAYSHQAPQRGDIVVLRYPLNPSITFVKRVIGVGGDVVRIVQEKVYVNGKLLNEPYAHFEPYRTTPLAANFPPPVSEIPSLPAYWGLDPAWARQMPQFIRPDGLHVPEGYPFCMGDNRDNSLDSRFWGFVPQADILGKARVIYFSWDAKARRVRWDRIGEILR